MGQGPRQGKVEGQGQSLGLGGMPLPSPLALAVPLSPCAPPPSAAAGACGNRAQSRRALCCAGPGRVPLLAVALCAPVQPWEKEPRREVGLEGGLGEGVVARRVIITT